MKRIRDSSMETSRVTFGHIDSTYLRFLCLRIVTSIRFSVNLPCVAANGESYPCCGFHFRGHHDALMAVDDYDKLVLVAEDLGVIWT